MKKGVGEKEEGKIAKRDKLCALIGLVAAAFTFVDFWSRTQKTVGLPHTIVWAFLIGVTSFTIAKLFFFILHCSTGIFSLDDIVYVAIVVVKHYWKMFVRNLLLIAFILIVCLETTALFLITSASSDINLSLCIYTVYLIILELILIAFYCLTRIQDRERHGVIAHKVLESCRPEVPYKPVGQNMNEIINERIGRLRDVNLICVTAVHFSHMFGNEELLIEIAKNNPRASVYYMPQFPFSWHILERSTELSRHFKKAHFHPLVNAIYNSRKHLKAEVRLRLNKADFRLILWAKYRKGIVPDEGFTKAGDWAKSAGKITTGGGYIQQYEHSEEGYLSPLFELDKKRWLESYLHILEWFFKDWADTIPVKLDVDERAPEEDYVMKCEDYMERVVAELVVSNSKARKMREAQKLREYINENKKLRMFYNAIEKGYI